VTQYRVGDRVLKGAKTPCVISDVTTTENGLRYWVSYYQYETCNPITEPLIGGGSSGSWGPDDFSAVTDPLMILRCELTDTHRKVKALEGELKAAKRRFDMLQGALKIISDAQAVVAKPSKSDA
jgi:hypothetical protein